MIVSVSDRPPIQPFEYWFMVPDLAYELLYGRSEMRATNMIARAQTTFRFNGRQPDATKVVWEQARSALA